MVAGWELRRMAASPGNLAIAAGVFAFFAGLVLFKHEWAIPLETAAGRGVVLDVLGSTALGLIFEVVALLLLFFGVMVPFVTADAVARDQRRRVHEILMATPVSNLAYVMGRFAAALAVALALSVVMLAAIVLGDAVVHGSQSDFPSVNLAALAVDWLVLVAPAVVVLAGLSFLLSTLFPGLSGTAKVAIVILWVGLSVVVDIGHGLGWFGYWTPTGDGVPKVLPQEYAARFAALVQGHGDTGAQALAVQQQLPDLSPWIGPHIGLVLLGIGCAAAAALGFRRFQDS